MSMAIANKTTPINQGKNDFLAVVSSGLAAGGGAGLCLGAFDLAGEDFLAILFIWFQVDEEFDGFVQDWRQSVFFLQGLQALFLVEYPM
jgi:hypothetical protein